MDRFAGFLETKVGKLTIVILLLLIILSPPYSEEYSMGDAARWVLASMIGWLCVYTLLSYRKSTYGKLWQLGAVFVPLLVVPIFFWRVGKMPFKKEQVTQ